MMLLFQLVAAALVCLPASEFLSSAAPATDGITALANRLLNGHGDAFEFRLTAEHDNWSRWNPPANDNYTVRPGQAGNKILIEGTTLNALARGLRHYANSVLQIDQFWSVDTYKKPPAVLPVPANPLTGASVVPWRYNLNTVTFSYTFVWYQWQDWERLLDWAALRGVNLQLAWVGYEQIFLDSFKALGLEDSEILPFFSGPAFQAWNRFGNIQGSWGGQGDVPLQFIRDQFDLQKKIVARMVELGITPVLPAFPGFVPAALKRVRPEANLTASPNWSPPLPDRYTRDLFLDPMDKTYAELQRLFVSKQIEAFGNVTNLYTLDQFNEVKPASGDAGYLSGVSRSAYAGLTAANPAAVWLLQGWLFYDSRAFWTQARIDAYLGGVTEARGMLVLDLFSEVYPQWQRTNSYSGKPWIWCQLHDFGGNMALEGRVHTLTSAPVDALSRSPSLVGFGLTPEAYEGNDIVYDILLDQAWSPRPLDTRDYFRHWTAKRYALAPYQQQLPSHIADAWDLLRTHVYSNPRTDIPQVPMALYQARPALSGIFNRTGHSPHPTAIPYDPKVLPKAWRLMTKAAQDQPALWQVPAFQHDMIDLTRQVLSNAFDPLYETLVHAYEHAISPVKNPRSFSSFFSFFPKHNLQATGRKMLHLLSDLDHLLLLNKHFTLRAWTDAAASWGASFPPATQKLFALNARSQVTVWQVDAVRLNDYAAKAWAGLVGSYYKRRWAIFVDALADAAHARRALDQRDLERKLAAFEAAWQTQSGDDAVVSAEEQRDFGAVFRRLERDWAEIFPA